MNATAINEHLANGGYVQVATYTRSWLYTPKHVGWFSDDGKFLYVRSGKSRNCLGTVTTLYVGIRFLTKKS